MPTSPIDAPPPPDVPRVSCADGYYWRPRRPECLTGSTSLTVERVQACAEGTPATRGEALALLTVGQLLALFPDCCAVCGAAHRIGADNLARAYRGIHPSVRPLAAPLPSRAYIVLGAVRRETPSATARAQVLWVASYLAGGVKSKAKEAI